MTRERPTEPHDRLIPHITRRCERCDYRHEGPRCPRGAVVPVPAWMPAAAREVDQQLRAFAARYPDRFEWRDGKLRTKGKP